MTITVLFSIIFRLKLLPQLAQYTIIPGSVFLHNEICPLKTFPSFSLHIPRNR